jgi:hypothetical protein
MVMLMFGVASDPAISSRPRQGADNYVVALELVNDDAERRMSGRRLAELGGAAT